MIIVGQASYHGMRAGLVSSADEESARSGVANTDIYRAT